MSYSGQRLDLDKARKYIYIRISGRNSKILKYYLTHYGDFSNGQPCNKAECKLLSKYEQLQFLKIYKQMFKNVIIDIDKYSGVDQLQEGACSFVAFLNLVRLNGREASVFKENWSKVRRGWKKYWKAMPASKDDGSADIADTLDQMIASGLFVEGFNEGLTYIPIRSRGNAENKYNNTFWSEIESRKRFGSLYEFMRNYKVTPFVFETGRLLEDLIDRGVPVEVNFSQHSRVMVAYNDTHILLADSWSKNFKQTYKDMDYDAYAAGFSVVNKWYAYTNIRDIVYFTPPWEALAKQEESESNKEFKKLMKKLRF